MVGLQAVRAGRRCVSSPKSADFGYQESTASMQWRDHDSSP